MNLILLLPEDFVAESKVLLRGRRLLHIREVHRAVEGQALTVGRLDGLIGTGRVISISRDQVELDVELTREPPPPLPLTLVLALPRPKVLNRVIAAISSLGVKKLYVVNSWRVEKSYWKSPRLSSENLREQCILGLEQAGDTMMPQIEMKRLFTPFLRDELAGIAEGTRRLVAHPYESVPCPSATRGPITLIIGPEGGFIEDEIRAFCDLGFEPVSIGPRILRVETAIPYLLARLS
ncbi:MAG TPA: 16S rRNA (uracil(1498)-N(3))-methyltransferase [Thermoanaerobaculia bacterium]|nr:16S rRNA (uracil(1498)-N(3))-methyltransferase [Thermoanaerobaculia bacterium]